jgi:hypothetical protein
MFLLKVEQNVEWAAFQNFVANLWFYYYYFFFLICGANVANILNSFVEKATAKSKVINLGGSSNLHVLNSQTCKSLKNMCFIYAFHFYLKYRAIIAAGTVAAVVVELYFGIGFRHNA